MSTFHVQFIRWAPDLLQIAMTSDNLNHHDAFMKLFLENQRGLLRYVMCLVPNANDAREIVQNTSIALWKKFEHYDTDQPFMGWACRFALIETREFMRTQARWQRFLDEDTVQLLLSRRSEVTDELDERRIHLRECLRKLAAKQLATVEAYYFDDQSVEQIASSTARNVDAVYKSLQRIRAGLMQCVNRRVESMKAT